ncbi:MAG TPA: hypothetical protein VGB26_13685 [Nitrospiria bacterium]|jgi:hypothetical protein
MIQIPILLVITGLLIVGLFQGIKWLKKNHVRIGINRIPSPREMLFLTMAWKIIRMILFRIILRR